MMIQRTDHRRKGSLDLIYTLLIFLSLLYIGVGSYATYDIQINCVGYDSLKASYDAKPNTPFNLTNGTGGPIIDASPWWDPFGVISWLGNGIGFLSLMFGGCTGIPWEIYLIIFVVPMIVIGIYAYQLVRSGG